MQRIRRTIIGIMMSFLLTLFLLEVGLRLTDPLALEQQVEWQVFHRENRIPTSYGYDIPAGVYSVSDDRLTIDADGNRWVGSRPQDCTIVLLGDSISFEWGVSDDEQYAYLLQTMIPAIELVNTAKPAYESLNLSRTQASYPADGYIYLIVNNDWLPPTDGQPFQVDSSSLSLQTHIRLFRYNLSLPKTEQIDWAFYDQTLQELQSRPTLYFAFDENSVSRYAAERVPVISMPPIPRFGYADAHPNAEGHRVIANAMVRPVKDFVDEVC